MSAAPDLDAALDAALSEPLPGADDAAPKPPPAPKRKRSKPAPTQPRARRGAPARSLAPDLLELFAAVGLMVAPFNAADSEAILAGAEKLATALDHVQQRNPAVRRALNALLTGATSTELVMAIAGIAVPIAANHGLIAPQLGQMFTTAAVVAPTSKPADADAAVE